MMKQMYLIKKNITPASKKIPKDFVMNFKIEKDIS